MIRLQSLTLQRGPQRLLEDAELTLHAGHKAGLIGATGAGKSTLFALLLGELTPDSGDCLLPADWRIAHMRQEIDTLDRIAIDYVLDGDLRLRQVQHDLAEAEKAQDGAAVVEFMSRAQRIARVHHFGETDAVNPGGPQYKYPARELLGITEDDASSLRDALMAHFTD